MVNKVVLGQFYVRTLRYSSISIISQSPNLIQH